MHPLNYGIFPESDIEFVEVTIDSHYERKDKQPDVIAKDVDGREYLIEFVFKYKIQHKQAIDYNKLTCLVIDLSNQSLSSLEKFLLEDNNDRRWINNEIYFNQIEERYSKRNKLVKVVDESICTNCVIRYKCCAVMIPNMYPKVPIWIENSGKRYRICKTELYNGALEEHKQQEIERQNLEEQCRIEEREQRREILRPQKGKNANQGVDNPSDRTCFECEYNLEWANKENTANCGISERLDIPRSHNPNKAKSCLSFRPKKS